MKKYSYSLILLIALTVNRSNAMETADKTNLCYAAAGAAIGFPLGEYIIRKIHHESLNSTLVISPISKAVAKLDAKKASFIVAACACFFGGILLLESKNLLNESRDFIEDQGRLIERQRDLLAQQQQAIDTLQTALYRNETQVKHLTYEQFRQRQG